MILEIDIDKTGCNIHLFECKDEYERCVHSSASYFERMKRTGYNSYDRFDSEPSKFPCIGIEVGWFPNSDGPDELRVLWLYPGVNCKVIEE